MKKFSTLLLVLLSFVFLSNVNSQTPLKLNLTGGLNVPMGGFNDVYKSGVSIEGGVFYSIPLTGIDLTFTAGYNGFSFRNDYFTNLVQTNLGVPVDGFNPSWTATDIPIMIGAKYNFPLIPFSPYIWGEVGAHMLSFKDRLTGTMQGNSSSPTTISYQGSTESGSETAFGYAIGGGVTIPLLPKIGLDFNIKYNSNGGIYSKQFTVFRNNNSTFTNPELKNMSFLTTRIGILISL